MCYKFKGIQDLQYNDLPFFYPIVKFRAIQPLLSVSGILFCSLMVCLEGVQRENQVCEGAAR